MTLNLAIRGHDFNKRITPEELAQEISKVGLKNIQFAINISFPEVASEKENMNSGMGNYYRRIFEEKDIQITVLSCYINMIHPDENERKNVLEKFNSYLRTAKAFGADMVATETGNIDAEIHYTEDNFTEEAFEKVVTSVKQMATYAEKMGMIVAIEGGLNHPIYSPQKIKDLLDRVQSPNVQIILDTTNFLRVDTWEDQRKIIDQSFELFGDKIAALHLKDFVVEGNSLKPVAIGEGLMDFPYLIERVRKEKPFLPLIMEETKEPFVPEAIKLLNEIARKL